MVQSGKAVFKINSTNSDQVVIFVGGISFKIRRSSHRSHRCPWRHSGPLGGRRGTNGFRSTVAPNGPHLSWQSRP